MTEAGWTRGNDAAETYADKAAIEAVRHVLGAHKLTCDEHENLQQDFKDVAQEAYQQGRVAGLEAIRQVCVDYEDCCLLGMVSHQNKIVTNASIGAIQFIRRQIDDLLAQAAEDEKGVGDA